MHEVNQLVGHSRSHHQIIFRRSIEASRSLSGGEPTQLRLPDYKVKGYECGCRSCERVFSSEEAFDLHRVGDYSEGRKCAENPATQGLTLSSRGIWQRDRSADATGGKS